LSLDGEWTDGVSTISGDGIPGGDFVFTFNVMPGDVNQDGTVSLTDLLEIRDRIGTFSSHPDYSRLADVTGDGRIERDDYAAAGRNLGSGLEIEVAALQTVPEPTTLALAVLGLMGFAVRWRRGRR